jgi:hypothetical protein
MRRFQIHKKSEVSRSAVGKASVNEELDLASGAVRMCLKMWAVHFPISSYTQCQLVFIMICLAM